MTEFSLTPVQLDLLQQPLEGYLFLEGPAGAGKTTAGVLRMLALLEAGIPGDSLLLFVPQRTLAEAYYATLRKPETPSGGSVAVLTVGGLAQRMVDLFWPVMAEKSRFLLPDELPSFLTLETAQYYMARLVQPLLDEEGLFDSVTIDRNRLYSQILDNLNKAAVMGFAHNEIGERLKRAWVGEPGQMRVYDDVQTCASKFRQFCLAHNLLDFSLQLEVFWKYLWPEPFCRDYLTQTYRHLIFDNLEEDMPVAHDLLRQWLPQFDSALLIYDWDAGYRRFLGANPDGAYELRALCQKQVVFEQSLVVSPGISDLTGHLVGALGESLPSPAKTGSINLAALEYTYHRFYPQMLDWVVEQIAHLVLNEGVPPGEIVVLAPFLSDALRFSLANRLEAHQIPVRSHRPSRSLREEPATHCLLTLAALASPQWGVRPTKFDVAYSLMQSIDGLDLVRAQLLTDIVYRQCEGVVALSSFDQIKPEMQERITYRLGERFENLRLWLEAAQDGMDEFDHFLSRLFGEVLSQPGYGFHASYDAGEVTANLIESVQKFRWSAGGTLELEGVPLGQEYLAMVQRGVIAAQYLGGWQAPPEDAVLLAPAYTFLMSNRPVEVQFWLDVGSRGWSERLYQPLTHPYVLSRVWEIGRLWTDADEVRVGQEALYRLALGLLRRCRSRVYLGLSELGEQGYEQRGPLLIALQRVLRNLVGDLSQMIEGVEAIKIALRPKQKEILAYRAGRMGISAVPGSGKTWTLSLLTAKIIARNVLADDQEVLIVTLVNSAVQNFSQRVSTFVKGWGLLPNLGYRVRTLHGLAHDIVRERPGLVGLAENFQIIDEREADSIRDEVAQSWMHSHPDELEGYLDQIQGEGSLEWARSKKLPELVKSIALAFIRSAKDARLTPERLRQRLDELPAPLPLAQMGCEIYASYQRALAYRGAVDFDDLIRLALQALESDEDYLKRLRLRWPYILEDEAQDSSRLQEEILKLLAGPKGNWVRVGDPNQAIFETFTTASPRYLREFVQRKGVKKQTLPNSGRSTYSIIDLANHLVEWVQNEHPVEQVRDALQAPPWIEPTPLDDPQVNPPDDPAGIRLVMRKFTPQEEIEAVADSLAKWLPDHQDWTVAVLAPRNQRGFELVDELRRRNIVYEDGLLRSSSATRFSAGALGNLLRYLADPGSARKLATAYQVWRRGDRQEAEAKAQVERVAEALRKLERVEDFLWPGPGEDWLPSISLAVEGDEVDAEVYESLAGFRTLIRRWQQAALLPVDQIALTLAQDLLTDPTELAIAHKLAVLLRQAGQLHPSWRLPELTEELAVIARNERRFLGFSEDDSGFDPDRYRGKVVVATLHKAKGLEWDRVYLMSTNNYDYPSAQEYDTYISERWFLRDKLNLEAETLAQLQAALATSEYDWYQEGAATQQARLDYVRERLRLLYVGITRARRELVITWNSGKGKIAATPAQPLLELQEFWQKYLQERGFV